MITNENKKRILEAIATNRTNYPSDAKHAASLGISTSVYSAIKNGLTEKSLSEANCWASAATRGPASRIVSTIPSIPYNAFATTIDTDQKSVE